MKIRLYQHSIRLRVSPSEMEKLLQGSPLTEHFFWGENGMSGLTFRLIPSTSNYLATGSDPGTYDIHWSNLLIADWGNSEEVGMYDDLGSEEYQLAVSIEKDFACKGRDNENKADRFPNPNEEAC